MSPTRTSNRISNPLHSIGASAWPVVASIYPAFPYATDGLILANQPSSGWYSVGKQAWVTAQTTQFTAPGWTYIDSASGYIGGSGSNGRYVTLRAPEGTDWGSSGAA